MDFRTVFRRAGIRAAAVVASLALAGPHLALADDQAQELAARFEAAAREAARFSFDTSYEQFEALLAEVEPGSEAWLKAVFGKAISAQHRTPPSQDLIVEAQGLFQQIIDAAPQSELAARAMLTLGRIHELRDFPGDEIDLNAAIEQYRRVIAEYGDRPILHEAVMRLAGAHIQQFEDKQTVRVGIEILEQHLAEHPDNPLNSAMWQYIGDSYFLRLHEKSPALDAYMQADKLKLIDPVQAGRLYWRMARLAEDVGRREVAIAYYQKIVTDTPQSGRAFEAQQALKGYQQDDPSIVIPEINLFQVN